MAYHDKVYVSMDADSDLRYYRLMQAWKQNDNIGFDFRDAHDLNNIYDKSEESIKAGLQERFRHTKVFVLLVDALDEAADHHFGGVEVGDDTVPQGADGLDTRIDTFVHQLGLLAEGDAFAGIVVDRHDARLIQGDHVMLENDGVGGPEVDGELLVQEGKCHISL